MTEAIATRFELHVEAGVAFMRRCADRLDHEQVRRFAARPDATVPAARRAC